jgi:ABC-type amino acid transport substrate-binding protein
VKQFEQELNKKLGNKVVTVHVIAIPVPRDELLPRLEAGQGDIAAAALTVTPGPPEAASISRSPSRTDVRECW